MSRRLYIITETVITKIYGIPSAKYTVGIHAQGFLLFLVLDFMNLIELLVNFKKIIYNMFFLVELIKELELIYNKGFSSGFYLRTPTSDDFSNIQSNASAEKKHFVGKVTHYFDKAGVAAIKLVSDLKVGDKIVIIGETTGIVKSKIESLEMKNSKIEKGKKGDEVGIKISKVRKNDEVYVLKENKIKN